MPPSVLENALVRLSVSAVGDTWELLDKRAGVSWGSGGVPWLSIRHGTRPDAEQNPLALGSVEEVAEALRCRFVDRSGNDARLALVLRLVDDKLQVYLVPDAGAAFSAVEVLANGLDVSAEDGGDALVPIRMGLLVPARGDGPFDLHLDTYAYEGVHMAMSGLFKAGAVLMATWGDPYVIVNLRRQGGAARLAMSFTLSGSARSLQLQCLGPGDLSTLAEAYRQRATALGYRVPWAEKLKTRPQAAGLFGACNVKLWHALARRIDQDLNEVSVEVNWTFDEAAQVAEHLKHDLQLEGVLFHLGGWTRYGYDVRHPDIMPANPECGGNEGLADCVRRVQALGYLFCLHDNYQDMYRDAPSWDESILQKDADGSPHKGGVWLGGQAYYTCSREAVKLAMRPENLPLVKATFAPDVYFIDTTYAVGLQECYDPRHPLTRQDDMRWKQAISDDARDVMGLFGSECGREWAVPHADFFEGLTSVSGRYYHQLDPDVLGARVVPFFDMVFRDGIALHGKYGYKPETVAEQVISHAAMGRPLYYHSLGKHLYWQDPDSLAEMPPADGPCDPALYTRGHNGWAEGMCLWDRFMKNTHEILGPLHRLTAETLIARHEFLDDSRRVCRTTFGNGVTATVNGSPSDVPARSELGGEMVLPPYGLLVEAGTFAAFVARSWNGYEYGAPVLFTLTSLDGQALSASSRVRVFHGFGEGDIAWRGGVLRVEREQII